MKTVATDKRKIRNMCFTLNNYTNDEFQQLKTMEHKYIVIGEETGENGTPHLQGYAEFHNPRNFSALKKSFPRLHIEERKGTALQASNYCKKENKYYENGDLSQQGKRTDLDDVATAVLNKSSLRDIAMTYPTTFIKYHKGINALAETIMEHRTTKPTVHWYYGKSGAGKTKQATAFAQSYYMKDNTQWWNGYTQQECIVIDDFDRNSWNFRDLLRLLDYYHYQGQTKGGYVKINSPYIIITCEYAPKDIFLGTEVIQIQRRINTIIHFGTEVTGNTMPSLLSQEYMDE